MKTNFAIFDVDYTILNGDSMLLMLIFGIKKRPLIIFYIPIILVKTVFSLLGIIDKKIAKDAINIPLRYLKEEEVEQFYNDVLLKKINVEVMKCLKKHKEDGCYVLLASASSESYLNYFAEDDYIDVVIGTRVNKINNKIEDENCKGIEKVKRINAYLEENNLEIDFENSFAYSDSLSDKPMLTLVKNRYKVNKIKGTIGEFIW